ncbi:hypothetical protein RN001_012039 [Aquatica leii]|uniref:Tyr recombinase domain-containing protein n=1 Tax=Aquatica leii TaxID=1421715 RepID=A0AAN7PTU5_9COLE|nr:hypothetical protein RN001_012039 [Aquatica leii]
MFEEEMQLTPPELRVIAQDTLKNLLPSKSKSEYEKAYSKFLEWSHANNVTVVTENVMISFFKGKRETFKSSTLWKLYSMLRTMLNIRQNIDIAKFANLQVLLKNYSKSYIAKKSKTLNFDQVEAFLKNAPDINYLVVKVALIIGYTGACRRQELTNMSIKDLEFKESIIFVSIPNSKNGQPRYFAITKEEWVALIKKYIELRPEAVTHDRLFLNYRTGHCTVQPIGINKMGEMPKVIASFLNLENPEQYSGHCFRRSSASELANRGGDILTLKQHGGWKSSSAAEGYIETSKKRKVEVSDILSKPGFSGAGTSQNNKSKESIQITSAANETRSENVVIQNTNSVPCVTINTGSNCTVSVQINNN